MPYKIRKVKNQNCYKVYNVKTKRVFAKCTDKKNASKQIRLLRGLEYNSAFSKRVRGSKYITRKNRK